MLTRILFAALGLTLALPARAQIVKLAFPEPVGYVASVSGQANTAASHAIAIEAGAQRPVRILKVCVTNPGIQTAAGFRVLLLERTTSAGTNGIVTAEAAGASAAALARVNGAAAAFSGIVRAKPTALGAQGATIALLPVWVPAAAAFAQPVCLDFTSPYDRPPRIPPGTTNGIALRDPGAAGGASFAAFVVFAEE
jgi:hypothetical protein